MIKWQHAQDLIVFVREDGAFGGVEHVEVGYYVEVGEHYAFRLSKQYISIDSSIFHLTKLEKRSRKHDAGFLMNRWGKMQIDR